MGDYYDFDGNEITVGEWSTLFDDKEKRRVDRTTVHGFKVSTVFLGINHQWGDGPPLIYETMVFSPDIFDELYCEQHSTWDEAQKAHDRIVREVVPCFSWWVDYEDNDGL